MSEFENAPRSAKRRGVLQIAIFHFGFFYSGGGEKLVLEEIRGLRALGHDVDCYAPYVDQLRCFPDYPEIRDINRMLPHPPSWLPLSHAIWVLACCLLVPLMAARFRRYDVLIGANQPAPWFTYVIGRILRKPYIVYLAQPLRLLHPRQVDQENGLRIQDGDQEFVRLVTKVASPLINRLDRITIRNANSVLTNGQHVADWISRIYSVDSMICPAGCHPATGEEIERTKTGSGIARLRKLGISTRFILLTNRHSPMKRFEYALWALKAVSREFDDITLVITGQETTYTDQLRYLTHGLGLEQKVKFIGLVKEKDLRLLYLHASLYVYTSPEEDFGMGVIEAMAAGTPVVAWNNAGPAVTIVDKETGFLVPPYDTEAFSEFIAVLLRNQDLATAMGIRGLARARSLFSYQRHVTQLEIAVQDAMLGQRSKIELIPIKQSIRFSEIYPAGDDADIPTALQLQNEVLDSEFEPHGKA